MKYAPSNSKKNGMLFFDFIALSHFDFYFSAKLIAECWREERVERALRERER